MSEQYHLKIIVKALPLRINQTSGKHWIIRHKESAKWMRLIEQQIVYGKHSIPKSPLNKAKLTLTRHSSKEPDFDNLVHSFKSTTDCLKKLRIIEDDKMSVIGQPTFKWIATGPKNGHIEIEVESA